MRSPDDLRASKAAAEARSRIRAERLDIERSRTRQFLIVQSVLLGIAVATVVALGAFGLLARFVFLTSLVFCGVAAVLTLAGWVWFQGGRKHRAMVLWLLYVDSVVGLIFFYVAGEFETPALGIMGFVVVMAPMFVGKKHAWGLAFLQVVVYLALLAIRQADLFVDLLPYGYLLPREYVTRPGFVFDSIAGFAISAFGFAYLSGRFSIDILTSQQQLEEEVSAKTAELARASAGLSHANEDLAQANQKLEKANAELRVANGRLAQFNAAVSHDLRSPLQTMVARAELVALTARTNPERAERMADEIILAAQQLALQIDELLKLARVGERLGELEPVSLARVVSQASQNLQQRMRDQNARLELVHPLPTALGNSTLLQELFQNLLENAIKYGAQGSPLIRVEPASAQPGQVAVAVEDNGEGIPADFRAHVFGLFKRLDTHRQQEGVGAGLAIVQRIVEVHGGQVRVEDGRALSGARFVVELPAPPAEPTLLPGSPEGQSNRIH